MAHTLEHYRDYAARRDVGPGAPSGPTPKVSLITIALNAASTLPRTIASVQRQSFASIEHIVVDGGSKDDTRVLLESLLRPEDYWISEPDRGISDALNKGVALARGEYIQFIHADDWLSEDQVAHAVAALERTDAEFVFGDLVFYEGDQPVFVYQGDPNYQRVIGRRLPTLNHPTVLARWACFRRIGLFELRYRCAMEYDWFMRLHLAGGRGVYEPKVRGHMNHDGISNLEFHRTIREVQAIAVAYGRDPARARAEALLQHVKMSAGRWTKARARPLYDLVRRTINPSFRPLE